MRQTHVFARFVVVLSLLITISAFAETADLPAEKRGAQAWLRKIQSAAQRLNYLGTFVYQQGNQMRTSRITHLFEGRNEIEKLEILDGKPREYIRKNDEVICYVPEARTLQIEQRVMHDVFPAMLADTPLNLTEFYEVHMGESGRVAGHDSQTIVLEPKDNLRYGYRLWAEKSTGLLLRAQTLNEKHEVVEQISFTQLSIGNVDPGRVKTSFSNTTGWRVDKATMSAANLTGWTVKSLPVGFKKIRDVKRMLPEVSATSVAATTAQAVHREVTQIVFSDGLAAISVFIEPGSQSRTEGSMQQGAMNIIGRRYGDFWLTIVGEVPAASLRQIANSIEFKSK